MMNSNDSSRSMYLPAPTGQVFSRQESLLLGQVYHPCRIQSRSQPTIANLYRSPGVSHLGRDSITDKSVLSLHTDSSSNHNVRSSTQKTTSLLQNSCTCLSSTGPRPTRGTAAIKGWKRAQTDTSLQRCPTSSHVNIWLGSERKITASKTRPGSPHAAASRLAPRQHGTNSDECRQPTSSSSSVDNRHTTSDGVQAAGSQRSPPARAPAKDKLYISSMEYLHCESGACIFGVRSPPKVMVNQEDQNYLSRSTLASTFGREH